MILNWLFRWLIPHWDILIENPLTGKPSSKNMFGVLGFYVGVMLTIAWTVAGIAQNKDPDWTVILPLTINGLGLAALKIWQGQANRKTQDEDGALAEPQPEPPTKPELMPQGPQPPTPENLAGYSNNRIE